MDARHEQRIIDNVLNQVRVLIKQAANRNNNNSSNNSDNKNSSKDDSLSIKKLSELEDKFDILYRQVRDNPVHEKVEGINNIVKSNKSNMDVLKSTFDANKLESDSKIETYNKILEE